MKLHLGCGKRFIPGYVHVDVVPFPHVDHVAPIDAMPFIAGGSVDVIYNCHVLEHFKRQDTLRVLREWHRLLRPGGVLRTAVPDFARLVELYVRTGELALVMGGLFGRQDYLYNIHYTAFDETTLAAAMTEAGFTGVRRYDWRTTDHADVDDYSQAYIPHMDKENGLLISLNVEATKPAG